MRVVAVWAIAAVTLLGGLAALLVQGYLAYGFGVADAAVREREQFLSTLLSSIGTPLVFAGLTSLLIAISVHAVLWRRARLSPRPAPRPPGSSP